MGIFFLSGLCSAACGYSVHSGAPPSSARVAVVRIAVTASGCRPVPASVSAPVVEIAVNNLDAPTVSEVEIRTANLSRVLGERENLIEGLAETFALHLRPGSYVVDCPGALQQHWPLAVSAVTPASH